MFVPKFSETYCPEGYMRVESGEMEGMLFRPEFFTLSAEERERICNGIGAEKGLTKHFPDTIWGLNVRIAGDCHDYDYYIGGTEDDKDTADCVFLHNMRVLIYRGFFLLRPLRLSRARKYYLAVSLGGDRHFNFHS